MRHRPRPRHRLLLPLLAALALLAGGCAVMGVSTRTLEAKPVIQCYDRLGTEAKQTRSQTEGCPSCVY